MNITIYIPSQENIQKLEIESHSPESIDALIQLEKQVTTEYFFLKTKPGNLTFDTELLFNWLKRIKDEGEIFSYSHYHQLNNETQTSVPTISYTEGSIRDDFNFGALVLIKTEVLSNFLKWNKKNYEFAGCYSFRLFASRQKQLHHWEEYCYEYRELDLRKSGEKQFDYVNPQNRARQIEMEEAATEHLALIGAKVDPPFQQVNFDVEIFPVEASVIIPVLNREKTIADAIHSVLNQKTNFDFNLIVIDNHSSDRTSSIIQNFKDKKIIHHVPQAINLGIGGCWNEGINHPRCGQFVVQLDSDDMYSDENTLQRIVDQFRKDGCAMVIGSYQMVNFKLEEIPPGIIDHKEWSDTNGPNNAIRINGLGAPRAFFTPIIREIGFPNVSYGEDYAVGLAISRTYKIGRIYEPLYLCRRWDENTDSNLSIEKINAHNVYKDSIRSCEIDARKK